MWRTNPLATKTNPNALAGKILEKGWKALSIEEKAIARKWSQELQKILPETEGNALLMLLKKKRTVASKPKSLGKIALMEKTKRAFRNKRKAKPA